MQQSIKFIEISELLDDVSKTNSKKEKVKLIKDLLIRSNSDELGYLVNMILGDPLKGRTKDLIQVGYSTLLDVLLDITGVKEQTIRELFVKYGDLGEVAYHIIKQRKETTLYEKDLTINDIIRATESISRISGKGSTELKKKILKSVLISAKPIEAKYIVKMLTGEMRTGVVEGIMEEAISEAFGIDKEKAEELHMLSGSLSYLAEKASKGQIAQIRLEYFRPVNFMLADTVKDPKEAYQHFSKPVYAEYKYDGIRAQIHKHGGQIKIYSRSLEDITIFFPELVFGISKAEDNFIIDGEIVPFKNNMPLPFHELQKRLRRQNDTGNVLKEIPVVFFAFDILILNDKETFREALSERISILEKIGPLNNVQFSTRKFVYSENDIDSFFKESIDKGYEGLVLKDPDSRYKLGKRGADWIKLKKELATIDAVIVAAEYGHGKRAGLLSDYTFAVKDGDSYAVIGKAYSGLTDQEIKDMTKKMLELTVEDHGFMKKVKPEIVIEVSFDRIQKSERHSSGYALRFPRIKRIRFDKKPEQISTLEDISKLYEKLSKSA